MPKRSGLALLAARVTAVALLFVQLLGSDVNQHFDTRGLADEGRIASFRPTLQMIAKHPWFGAGLGTFTRSFPRYRTTDDTLFGEWDLAQSTPLELVADPGISLATVIGLGWIVVPALLIRAVGRRRRDAIVVPLAALSVALIGLLHSMVDFVLQIPGYAIAAFGVVGDGPGQSVWIAPK